MTPLSTPAAQGTGADVEAAFRDGLNAAAEYLLACDDYGDRLKAEEIRKLQPPASLTPSESDYYARKDAELKQIAARLAELSPSEGLLCDGGTYVLEFRWTTDGELPTPPTRPSFDIIATVLRDYRLSNMRDDIGGAYPLVDLMSNDGHSIATGEEEMVWLADEISASLASDASPRGEAVAWRAVAHPETRMGTMVDQIKWKLIEDADSLYGPGKWDLQELGPLYAHPAPATVEMREALREIAEQDVTEIALDPDWPRRIANAALAPATPATSAEEQRFPSRKPRKSVLEDGPAGLADAHSKDPSRAAMPKEGDTYG
jgi:hypothetical protein